MGRLILGLCVLGLLSGCGGKPSSGAAGAGGSTAKEQSSQRVLQTTSTAAQVVEDLIAAAHQGTSYEIISVKEQPATAKKKPAVAVHLQWKVKGENEPKNELYLVQDGRVTTRIDYNPNLSLEDNVTALVKDVESP
jgi:hypothetical protein